MNPLVLLFLTATVTLTSGLQCYTCVYAKGQPWSNSNCEKSPTTLVNCTLATALNTIGVGIRDISLPRQNTTVMCATVKSSFNSSDVLLRNCVPGPSSLNNKCDIRDYQWTINLTNGTKIPLGNPPTCLCSTDKCNSGAYGTGGAGNLTNGHSIGFFIASIAVLKICLCKR